MISKIYLFPVFLCAFTVGTFAKPAYAHHHHEHHHHHGKNVELHSNYNPPGPPGDPWQPYINKASKRFDIPASWIRGVIRQESGGKVFNSRGELIRSSVGAMGLMQIMPSTYKFLSDQYHLGADGFNPYDNIMAGTAYLRQLYEVYGSPGFLAAYNAGSGRVDHYLKTTHTLPPETRNYVRSISRYLVGHYPRVRSRTDLLVTQYNGSAKDKWAATYMLKHMKPSQNLIDTSTIVVPPKPIPHVKNTHTARGRLSHSTNKVVSKRPVKGTVKTQPKEDSFSKVQHELAASVKKHATQPVKQNAQHVVHKVIKK